jgi:NAD(P)-dependent dehydrogenase (short-subunit alcohol dehydrogenase family)
VELRDKVAVVTGGASGIGRAMARRFAEEGARGVVVADLDGPGAEAVAAEIGDRARGVQADIARQDEIDKVIAAAREAFGPIDIFCANAGVGVGTDLDTPDDVWGLAIDVNVLAHVRAARRLVPEWVERGEGYFLVTASAAGLLTQIGSATYAVTKHAAVAFAEWLSVTYGDQGLRVSCLCPMGVNTAMLQAGMALDGEEGVSSRVVAATGDVLEPEQVADTVVEALAAERFLVLPHPQVLEFLRRKTSDYDRWLAGMRRLKAAVATA